MVMNKGRWKPYSQIFDGEKQYIAGRQLNLSEPLHGGNIEYSGGYTPFLDCVEIICKEMNEREGIIVAAN